MVAWLSLSKEFIMYKRTNYSFLKSIFFQDAFSWCQEKFKGGYIHDWSINENEWGVALDTYENAFQLPIEKLMLYVIAITGLSGRNKLAHYSIMSDIEDILSLNSLNDLIMDLEDVERDEFLRDLNIVMNNKLI